MQGLMSIHRGAPEPGEATALEAAFRGGHHAIVERLQAAIKGDHQVAETSCQ